MQITEAEYAKLIDMAAMPLGGSGLQPKSVYCTFGPNGVSLVNGPTNEWAIAAVRSWRDTTAPAPGQEGGE